MPERSWVKVILAWVVLAIPATLWSVVTAWNELYDDAYISFRYAQNLGTGMGLTWNPGETPTEGFTNLLLVLALTPSSALGLDPLMVSRVLGLVALISTCVLLSWSARRWLGVTGAGALAVGLCFSIVPAAQLLVLSGMETILFTALLVAAVLTGVQMIHRGGLALPTSFALLSFCAYLTRPEGALIFLVIAVGLAVSWKTVKPTRWVAVWGLAGFASLILMHLAWRSYTFDSLLPNPYYLKSTSALVTSSGAGSVVAFISVFAVAGLAALATVACWRSSGLASQASDQKRATTLLVTSCAMVVLYLVFILRTDTITDIAGRFAFPALPFLFLIGAPSVGLAVQTMMRPRGWSTPIAWLTLVVGLSLLAAVPLGTLTTALSPGFLRGASNSMAAQIDDNQQLKLANAFEQAANNVTAKVAYGDAGLVPYKSRLPWLDLVGLNDSVLARTTSLKDATDYVFNVAPDVFLVPVSHDGSLYRDGHGVLGDYSEWASDSRWSAYEYLGTFRRDDAPYDLLVIERSGSLPEKARRILQDELRLDYAITDARLISLGNTD